MGDGRRLPLGVQFGGSPAVVGVSHKVIHPGRNRKKAHESGHLESVLCSLHTVYWVLGTVCCVLGTLNVYCGLWIVEPRPG